MSNDSASFDAIIIGAGIGGLVCGGFLAKAGLRVLILEQHKIPGGYFTSFKRQGFMFDAAAHSFGNFRRGAHVRRVFEELGVTDLVTIDRHSPTDVVISPDFRLTFANNKQETIDGLATVFPRERDNIQRFYDYLTAYNPAQFTQLKSKTYLQFLQMFFRDEKLMTALSVPGFGNLGLPPSLLYAFNGAKNFSEFVIDGGYYPRGGIQKLSNALAKIVTSHGGKIMYSSLVEKILHNQDGACGVKLANGEELFSSCIVSACDTTQTVKKMLSSEVSSPETLRCLDNMVPALSDFILYIGIAREFDGQPNPGTNVWYLQDYDLDMAYEQVLKCNFEAPIPCMVRMSPDGRSVLAFMPAPFDAPFDWKERKMHIADIFLKKLKVLMPELVRHIIYLEAATPETLYRYTLNHKGSSFGWSKMASQTADVFLCKKPPIKGLYYVGHWGSIGTGMPGVCNSGYTTAKQIIKNFVAI